VTALYIVAPERSRRRRDAEDAALGGEMLVCVSDESYVRRDDRGAALRRHR
jgi:hypothetical protein